jgi:hypothetical protein
MPFCTKCGAELVEGEDHVCDAQKAVTETAAAQEIYQNGSSLNFETILTLIKNPFKGLTLSENSDFLYGILGLVISVIGIFIWFLGIFHNLTAGISGLPFLGQAISPSYTTVFLFGLLLVLLPCASFYAYSKWMGDRNQSFKQTVTSIGATQWLAGAGFILAAILSYISISISVGLFFTMYQINVLIIAFASLDLFVVTEQKRVPVIILSILTITIIWGIIGNYLISSLFQSIGSSLNSIMGGL